MSRNVFVLQHPLAGTCLRLLRDKNSPPEVFRTQVSRLGHMLALEITRDLQTRRERCETPLGPAEENVIFQRIGLAPVLRAGIGLVGPFLDFLPQAEVWCLGMYRDEATHEPVPYYNKLHEGTPVEIAYVIDPMLATGGSALFAIRALKDWGVRTIKFAGLVGAPEGIGAIHDKFPDVDIHLAARDEKLNKDAYIIPGLGDAGDRIFNT